MHSASPAWSLRLPRRFACLGLYLWACLVPAWPAVLDGPLASRVLAPVPACLPACPPPPIHAPIHARVPAPFPSLPPAVRGNRNIMDPTGWVAEWLEWNTTFYLIAKVRSLLPVPLLPPPPVPAASCPWCLLLLLRSCAGTCGASPQVHPTRLPICLFSLAAGHPQGAAAAEGRRPRRH
jgi:hypothetical protein